MAEAAAWGGGSSGSQRPSWFDFFVLFVPTVSSPVLNPLMMDFAITVDPNPTGIKKMAVMCIKIGGDGPCWNSAACTEHLLPCTGYSSV